jgi:hypothetical protein
MGGGLVGSAVAAAMGDPVLALATLPPAMAAIALLAFFGLKGATTRMEQAVADRIVAPRAPAE